ncbi:MAG: Internalin-A precursor [bacterium ADurb.Bin429]|nr:MAG: Internalin-A precursor [bacterium ADurb.Bin429]
MPTHRFRRQALRDLAILRADAGEVANALTVLRDMAALPQPDDSLRLVLDRLLDQCRTTPNTSALPALLSALPSIPMTTLDLSALELTSLDAVHGLPLTTLYCQDNCLTDLTSLRGMPLQLLSCRGNAVTDLTPLRGMPLHILHCEDNDITDLAPLTGMPLTSLFCWGNKIQDLTPLHGMPLRIFYCSQNAITDLTPLRGMPLESLVVNANRITDLTPLRGSTTLRGVYCSDNHLISLEPLRECILNDLTCDRNPISDLTPIADMPLEFLDCTACMLTDLSLLQGSPIRRLYCSENAIADLTPLAELPLEELVCDHTLVTDLMPLAMCPLRQLTIHGISLTVPNQELLAAIPLIELSCDLSPAAMTLPERIPSLTVLNKHTCAHVTQVGPVLYEVLAAWRAGHPSPSRQALRAYAETFGDTAYLALPVLLPRNDALALSHYLGAQLICPSTAEQQHAVEHYLAGVTVADAVLDPKVVTVLYHLGLGLDPTSKQLAWQSGAPYLWHTWKSQVNERLAASGGRLVCEYHCINKTVLWSCSQAPAYVLLEWDV